MLFLGVCSLVAIALVILIIYTAVEGARGNLGATQVPFRENPEDIQVVRVKACTPIISTSLTFVYL